jgi:hypothetical protein
VMAPDDWRRVHDVAARAIAAGADAVLAVTAPSDDDAPLWVELGDALGDAGAVRRVGGGPAPWITGGVYAFAPSARARARAVLDAGRERMRAFLAALVDGGADVRAVCVERIIDVDHARDLRAANAYLSLGHPRGSGEPPSVQCHSDREPSGAPTTVDSRSRGNDGRTVARA